MPDLAPGDQEMHRGTLAIVLTFAAVTLRLGTAQTATFYPIPTANSGLYGIATGPDGSIWFTESNTKRVGRITAAGAIQEFTVPPVTRSFNQMKRCKISRRAGTGRCGLEK